MKKPARFGKYYLLERVNIGGMAEVFKAKTLGVSGFEKLMAIKRILPAMAEDEDFINMFIDEARIAARLSHVNIIPIHELGKVGDQFYIAMDYLSGKDLRQVLDFMRNRSERMPLPLAVYIMANICAGLDYAHKKKDPTGRPMAIIHRDFTNAIMT